MLQVLSSEIVCGDSSTSCCTVNILDRCIQELEFGIFIFLVNLYSLKTLCQLGYAFISQVKFQVKNSGIFCI